MYFLLQSVVESRRSNASNHSKYIQPIYNELGLNFDNKNKRTKNNTSLTFCKEMI